MKKFLLNILLFLGCSVVFYAVMICLWGDFGPAILRKNLQDYRGSYGHTYSRIQDAKRAKDIDILFLGSSHTYRGFDPRIFASYGYKIFNLGSSSQTPMQTELLLTRYLDTISPKIVVYEVYPETFTLDGVESSLDIISNDDNDLLSLKMALAVNNIKVYNTLLYSYYRDFTKNDDNFVEDPKKNMDYYIPNGYVERQLTYYRKEEYPKSELVFKDDQFDSFKRILKMMKDRNIKVIFVQAPITPMRYQSYTNNDVFDADMKQFGPYYNFNTILHLDDSLHFYDSDHLNSVGVGLFNQKLVQVLKDNNELSPLQSALQPK